MLSVWQCTCLVYLKLCKQLLRLLNCVTQVDRLYAWKSTKDAPMKESLDKQSEHTRTEFRDRMKKSMLDLNEQGLNVALYWENPDIRKYVNIVPTSAITGEGIPDLLQLLVKLTQVGRPCHSQGHNTITRTMLAWCLHWQACNSMVSSPCGHGIVHTQTLCGLCRP